MKVRRGITVRSIGDQFAIIRKPATVFCSTSGDETAGLYLKNKEDREEL